MQPFSQLEMKNLKYINCENWLLAKNQSIDDQLYNKLKDMV